MGVVSLPAAMGRRVRQFFRAMTARVSWEELESITTYLSPEFLALFRSMAIQDQRHCLDVWHALRVSGHTDPDLLTAALLHDVGKAVAPLPTWQRAIVVLLRRLWPSLVHRWAGEAPPSVTARGDTLTGWRRPFVVHYWHPEIGARLVQECGGNPTVVALIRYHQEREGWESIPMGRQERRLLVALQTADERY
ncbi:MAG TPA: hypothetical protein ENF52_08180 [Chloroflexi bacterium]|nr:hypothetical protein [Chloroflexota bacterium]